MKRLVAGSSLMFQRLTGNFWEREHHFHWIMDNLREGNRLPFSR